MSRVAFVLVRAATGAEARVLDAIRRVPRVTESHILFGEYDFIARIEVDDTEEVSRVLVNEIRNIPSVVDTEALITVPQPGARWQEPVEAGPAVDLTLPTPTPWGSEPTRRPRPRSRVQ